MEKFLKSTRNTRLMVILIPIVLVILIVLAGPVDPTPPDYKTFGRNHRINYSPEESDLMRIWIVYIGQGDGILIQLPGEYNYDPNPDDNIDEKSERIDIMIDGGSSYSRNKTRMLEFLQSLYPQPEITIEHAVISHHDKDHILGLMSILQEPTIAVHNIYHNGLASYQPKVEILNDIQNSSGAILKKTSGEINRVMACLESDGETLKSSYLINRKEQLESKHNRGYFHGIYKDFAQAIIEKDEPQNVIRFSRVWEGEIFVKEIEASIRRDLSDIELKLIWPQKNLKAYKDWDKTINGNSVTFRIKYNDFKMLFTGDLNEFSEEALIKHLKENDNEHLLNCDILKVPHHGSKNNLKEFIVSNGSRPVLSVASMGKQGFNTRWKHPSTEIVKWAGGAHRFYSTYIHERKFKWSDMNDETKRNDMLELKHILIETDGKWFRLVEVDLDTVDLNKSLPVKQTRRGNGTRWIKAK